MQQVVEMGAILVPPMPAFYHKPKTIDDIVHQTVGRVLDLLAIEHESLFKRWTGPQERVRGD
jgi:4-hydroxy-3-polyprenylbenzoate decarboxylase